jgi:predicted aminopeptidase
MKTARFWLFPKLPVLIAAALILGASITCSGCYTIKQGAAMLGYLGRAVPLESIAALDGASEDGRLFVQRVENIRRFATQELGLAASRNYTRYVDLDRNYLAAVVSASAQDSFTRHHWWFPVVGRMPYKGFFNVEDARKERDRLEIGGLDVWIRAVDAFSTLGWFRDPLYSFMRHYSDYSLAELIIHELFHATVWINNQTQFNEELATFVGVQAARLYMEKTFGPAWRDEGQNDNGASQAQLQADRQAYLAFIQGLIAELEELYQSELHREQKLLQREEVFSAARARFEDTYDTVFVTDTYRFFTALPLNNA